MRKLLIALITAYRYMLSPWLGYHCRFYPSCSCYAREAIERHGTITGLRLAAARILRCHPWHDGGYDPVPCERPLTSKHHRSLHG
jgi:putative membrane protein insertion efficiency factor